MKKPNILFLMLDEHRYDLVGYLENDIVKTPTLDELAKDAVIFDNAYTPSPICIPARQCIMSGQFPKTCGCLEYSDDLEPFYMTFARWFSNNGYETVACGKLHHMGIDQMQGFSRRIGGDIHIDKRYLTLEEEVQEYPLPEGTGKWSDAKEIKRAGVGKNTPDKVFDRYAIEGAVNFIRERFVDTYYDRPNPEQPLLLKISLKKPHYPYLTSSEELFNYYINRVKVYDEEVFEHEFLKSRSVKIGTDVSLREAKRATASYYAMIEEADKEFKIVIDELKKVGQDLDDWIIVYTSDHGEMLGEHGVWEKQKFFEGSARVPLFIRYPKKYNKKIIKSNVNSCDIFATLCDLSDIKTPNNLDSNSMIELMDGDCSNWKNETISHYKGMGGSENLMIKLDNLKYHHYGSDNSEVLFDLEKNYKETINFINDKEYEKVLKYFRKRKRELGY